MASAYYTKALYSGVGALAIWDGTNLDDIFAVVLSVDADLSATAFNGGELTVWGEKIEIGDAVAATDDSPTALRHAKIPKATLEADEWRVLAVQFEGNHEEIMDFVGRNNSKISGGVLYANGTAINDTDYVYSVMGRRAGKKDVTTFEAAYTAE